MIHIIIVIALSFLGVYIAEVKPELESLLLLPFIYVVIFASYQLVKGLNYIIKSIFSRSAKENLNNNSIKKTSFIDDLYDGIISTIGLIFGLIFLFLVTFSWPIGLIKYVFRYSDLSHGDKWAEFFMFIMPGANIYYVYEIWFTIFRFIITKLYLIFQNF